MLYRICKNVMPFFLLYFLSSCTISLKDNPKKIFSKRIIFENGELQWYKYSLISGTSKGYVELLYKDSSKIICNSNSVKDIAFTDDSVIVIKFSDTPELYTPTFLQPKAFGFKIIKDTSEVGTIYEIRNGSYFKKEK